MLIIESIVLIVGFFGLLSIIHWICMSFKVVMMIFTDISRSDIERIGAHQGYIEN